ncbi:MAG: hypothetical protein AAFS10_19815 [Myxococcota bacterium]
MKMRCTTFHLGMLALVPMAVACQQVELQPLTNAPPTREASVDQKNHRIRLSEGVAMAVRCWDSCDTNCRGARVTVSGTQVHVHRAYRLAELGGSNVAYQPDKQSEEVFVLIGQERGDGKVKVESSCTSQSYNVSVLP